MRRTHRLALSFALSATRDCCERAALGKRKMRISICVRLPHALTILLLVAVAVLSGCEDRASKFVPSPHIAKHAIVDALDAWKAGQPSGPVANTAPLVHVTDNLRKANQRMVDYTILGEKASSHGRTFMVELNMASPNEKLKAEYIVVGIDPLWVFRREDYELLMHWDHHMPALPEDPSASKNP